MIVLLDRKKDFDKNGNMHNELRRAVKYADLVILRDGFGLKVLKHRTGFSLEDALLEIENFINGKINENL